jgi:hypothetical protein
LLLSCFGKAYLSNESSMFFWLVYGNGERKMFNLNCRALILMDHISNTCFRESQTYVEKKMRHVNDSLADILFNIQIIQKKQAEEVDAGPSEESGESAENGEVDHGATIGDEFDPVQAMKQLQELESFRKEQQAALQEAKRKLDGCTTEELDLATDDGTLAKLTSLRNGCAADVISTKAVFNLCRVVDGKADMLKFDIPQNETIADLDEILGSRRAIRKIEPVPGRQRRNKADGGKKALNDTTNARQSIQT